MFPAQDPITVTIPTPSPAEPYDRTAMLTHVHIIAVETLQWFKRDAEILHDNMGAYCATLASGGHETVKQKVLDSLTAVIVGSHEH